MASEDWEFPDQKLKREEHERRLVLAQVRRDIDEALKHHIGDTPACEQVAAAIRLFADVVAKGFYPNFKLSWDGSHEFLIETTITPNITPPTNSIRIIPTL